MEREALSLALWNFHQTSRVWGHEKRILILEEKECTAMSIQFRAIENRGGPEDSRMREETRSHTLEHHYDARDLMQVLEREQSQYIARTVSWYRELDNLRVSNGHRI
jgi:hypothetical protein